MAKGNMFLGMSRGSVGDVTFYRNRGNQVARARNRQPANPKTEAQVIQRMILATASKAYSRMKGIVDHSFQGVQYGGVSQSYFLKRAMDDIRNWVAQTITITGEYPAALRNPLVYRGLSFPLDAHQAGVGLLISEGTVPSVPAVLNTPEAGADAVVDHFGALINLDIDGIATCQQVMNALGAQVGDQITVVALTDNHVFSASRYVIKSDATAEELEESWPTSSDIDGGPFDPVKTSLNGPEISVNEGGAQGDPGKITVRYRLAGDTFAALEAAAIIISRKVGDVWQRSTQRLVWLSDAGDYTTTDVVAAEWMAGTAQIDTVNPRYLNQAEQSI